MTRFDRMLEALLAFVDENPDHVLWIGSSMGQAACGAELRRTQVYVSDLRLFMRRLGVAEGRWSERPAMAPTISVFVEPDALARFRRELSLVRVAGEPLESEEREKGFFSIAFGHPNLAREQEVLELGTTRIPFAAAGLENVTIEDQSASSGYHVPRGSLLVYDPLSGRRSGAREEMKTTAIAPSLLATLGLAPPSYMSSPAAFVG
jgi:hypothetical protein